MYRLRKWLLPYESVSPGPTDVTRGFTCWSCCNYSRSHKLVMTKQLHYVIGSTFEMLQLLVLLGKGAIGLKIICHSNTYHVSSQGEWIAVWSNSFNHFFLLMHLPKDIVVLIFDGSSQGGTASALFVSCLLMLDTDVQWLWDCSHCSLTTPHFSLIATVFCFVLLVLLSDLSGLIKIHHGYWLLPLKCPIPYLWQLQSFLLSLYCHSPCRYNWNSKAMNEWKTAIPLISYTIDMP